MAAIFLLGDANSWAVTDSFTTAGSTNWTCPANVFSATVECWGGGGSGGAGINGGGTTTGSGAGGGGGGAYVLKTISVTPGNSYSIVVGAGGAAGTASNPGSDSTFATTTAVAKGGAAGVSVNGASLAGAGGAGGSAAASIGDTKFSGGNGASGVAGSNPNGGGGGGSSAGTAANGNAGSTTTAGAAPTGGGAGGGGATSSANGSSASNPGGGGGGAKTASGTQRNGGAGGTGKVAVTYTVATVPTVTASAATSVTGTAATLNGNVTADGGATITERGFVYKTSAGATITDNKTTVSGTTGAFTLNLSTLTPGQIYFFKAYAINSVGTTLSSPELNFTTTGGTPPTLTATAGATVDSSFNVTFTDDATWRGLITGITVDGNALSGTAYSISAGQITFTPSASALLQTSGTKSIAVQSTGYSDSIVSQSIGFGAATRLALNTQPTAPSVNGGALAAQPIVAVQDQYSNNVTSSSATITATAVQGAWTLGGSTAVGAASGIATFAGLTASANTAVSGATINFTSGALTPVTSTGFNLPAPAPPTLTAAAGATVDSAFTVTFTDNSSWRAAITSITVGGTTLAGVAYVVSAGQITFTPSASVLLQSSGTKSIVVIATGFANNTVSQVIGFGAATKLGMTTQPTAPASNGGALAAQPVVAVQDQYGNTVTTSSVTIAASAVQGTWTLGGAPSVAAASGVAIFSGLTATAPAAVNGATINFTSSALTQITSTSFNIPAPAPALTEVFLPQFIQGGSSSNSKRVPYAYRVTL